MPSSRSGLPFAACFALIPLAACQSTNTAPPPAAVAAAPVATSAAPLPTGSGCGPAISRTQAIVASDVATGNLNEPVGKRFGADLGVAADACAAGREAEGLRLLAAAKARYGYR